jgi:hypothetical protein
MGNARLFILDASIERERRRWAEAMAAVSVLRGYPLIEIRSPLEVIDGEEA